MIQTMRFSAVSQIVPSQATKTVAEESVKSVVLKFLLSLLPLLCLSSCEDKGGNFRLEGEFRNMNQAELYLFDPITGRKDTISVSRGRFKYESFSQDTATLMLMFPNYSTMPVFAQKGVTLRLKGDASHLKETELKGSDENDEMTAFRLKAAQMTPPEEKEAAIAFINENPVSPVSAYLLRHYFVDTAEPDYQEAFRLCQTMVKADPHQKYLFPLYNQLRMLQSGSVGMKIPSFAVLDINDKVITNKDLDAPIKVFCLWASWSYESRELVATVRKKRSQNPGKIALVAISIDARRSEGESWVRRDSITNYLISDGRMWRTPLARALGMTAIPSNVIADRNGRIVARDIVKKGDLIKELDKLLEENK